MSYIEKMCFVNWRFRSFVQYINNNLFNDWDKDGAGIIYFV